MFPKDFIWGLSTAAYQIEGAVHEDGRGESIWDRFAHTPGNISDGATGDVACDSYHRYPEDIALLKQIGVNAYRFSVAWPRIFPNGTGEINQAGLDYYNRVVDALLEANITPFITLYHWDLPQALQDRGGWARRITADAFVEYATTMVRHLGDRVTYWMTHNEPWVVSILGNLNGIFAPGIRDLNTTLKVAHYLLLSHGMAVPAMRAAANRPLQIGIAPNYVPAYPFTDSEEDRGAAIRFDGFFNRWFFDPIFKGSYPADMVEHYRAGLTDVNLDEAKQIATEIDFLGVNYYDRALMSHDPSQVGLQMRPEKDPNYERSADREIYPPGLYDTLTRIQQDYNPPAIYITENGAAFPDVLEPDGSIHDPRRIKFLEDHFIQAKRALAAGVKLKGYFVWSLLDNFEWASGFSIRYGIVYTEYSTQNRYIKDSGRWLAEYLKGAKITNSLFS